MKRMTPGLLLVSLSTLALVACSPEDAGPNTASAPSTSVTQADTPGAPDPASAAVRDSAAGLSWTVPSHWQTLPQRPMRVVTYHAPPAHGDSDPGEMAVFYFGPQEGGTVDANVERWFNQFDQEDGRPTREVAERERIEVDGLPVTRVRARGTYNAAAGPMAPRADIRPNYRLIGAIAEGPEGAVFFKFTGPERTVLEQSAMFDQLVGSLRRD